MLCVDFCWPYGGACHGTVRLAVTRRRRHHALWRQAYHRVSSTGRKKQPRSLKVSSAKIARRDVETVARTSEMTRRELLTKWTGFRHCEVPLGPITVGAACYWSLRPDLFYLTRDTDLFGRGNRRRHRDLPFPVAAQSWHPVRIFGASRYGRIGVGSAGVAVVLDQHVETVFTAQVPAQDLIPGDRPSVAGGTPA